MEDRIEESYVRRPAAIKKKKKKKSWTIAKLMINLTVGAIIALSILMVIYYNDPRKKLIGRWKGSVEVTGEVSDKASDWFLAAAMGNKANVSKHLGDVNVDTHLNFNADGTWNSSVDRSSYDECEDRAYEAMAGALNEFVGIRLAAAQKSDMSSEDIDRLIVDTIGMSGKDYLKEYGPAIMPSYESLTAAYERDGTYTADKRTVTINDTVTADYVVNGSLLGLDGIQSGNSTILNRDGDIGDRVLSLFADAREDEALYMGRAHAATVKNRILENLTVHVSGGSVRDVKTIHYTYKNNRFISLRDMALALKGTEAEYSVSIGSSEISITKGKSYNAVGGENIPFKIRDNAKTPEETDMASDNTQITDVEPNPDTGQDTEVSANVIADTDTDYIYVSNSLKLNKISVDGKEVKYSTIIGKNPSGNQDAFMSITDIAMILDVDMSIEDGELYVDTSKPFGLDMAGIPDSGFYTEVRSALVGDATTSEIYASYCEDVAVSIASTTKLMNLLCVMDALSSGQISMQDTVRTSYEASALSKTGDGVIAMDEGEVFTVEELIYGMMLPSSNECALMLAEHIAGSEEAYVGRMNEKAMEIGLSESTRYYNCHGLPVFSDDIATSKLQNQMSAKDMFILASYMLAVYPQVTDITSTMEYKIVSKDITVKNLNPMLYNIPGAIGLKTGTTNMAGYSLVSAVRLKDASDIEHVIVAVEFGAEDVTTRNEMSEMLLRYGMDKASKGSSSGKNTVKLKDGENMPASAEALVRLLIKAADNR